MKLKSPDKFFNRPFTARISKLDKNEKISEISEIIDAGEEGNVTKFFQTHKEKLENINLNDKNAGS